MEISEIGLPDDLRQRLMEAAAIHNVTDLKMVADEIERMGGKQVADHLRDCIRKYDLLAVAAFAARLEQAVQLT